MNLKIIKRALSPLLLLFIPLIGNLFSNQVNWSLFDFIVIGILLVLAGLSIHFILEKVRNKILRIVPIIFVIIIILMIWAELAIGVFGSQIAGS